MDTTANTPTRRALRPLAGIAIAASVALLAIFGLQQTNTVGESDPVVIPSTQVNAVPDSGLQTDQNRQYFLNHANATSRLGANGMNARLVNLRFSEDVVEESDVDAADDKDPDNNDSTETVKQP